MQNVGEEICGEYLRNILNCDFVSYNIVNPDIQGEIDVFGIKLITEEVYICEVATHTGGLQYVKNKRPDDFNRFSEKFRKDISYAKKYFSEYTVVPMLWSPIVKISNPKAKYNTCNELQRLKQTIKEKYSLDLRLVINESFFEALNKLKEYTAKQTAEFNSPVMRIFQIEKSLEKHLNNLKKKEILPNNKRT